MNLANYKTFKDYLSSALVGDSLKVGPLFSGGLLPITLEVSKPRTVAPSGLCETTFDVMMGKVRAGTMVAEEAIDGSVSLLETSPVPQRELTVPANTISASDQTYTRALDRLASTLGISFEFLSSGLLSSKSVSRPVRVYLSLSDSGKQQVSLVFSLSGYTYNGEELTMLYRTAEELSFLITVNTRTWVMGLMVFPIPKTMDSPDNVSFSHIFNKFKGVTLESYVLHSGSWVRA